MQLSELIAMRVASCTRVLKQKNTLGGDKGRAERCYKGGAQGAGGIWGSPGGRRGRFWGTPGGCGCRTPGLSDALAVVP